MAFSSRKGKPKGSSNKGGTPLDARQRELREEQDRIEREMAALKEKIAQAPISDREAQRRARAAAAANKPPTQRRPTGATTFRHSAVLADPRYDEDEVAPPRNKPGRRRRAEVRQAQLQTLALIVLLAAAVFWALHWWLGA